MTAFRDFELQAIQLLAGETLTPELISIVSQISEPTSYEYTGSGYFLCVAHPLLPETEKTLGHPAVAGESGEIICGFVVFVGNHELTLECHTWGPVDVPEDFRDRSVVIRSPPANFTDRG